MPIPFLFILTLQDTLRVRPVPHPPSVEGTVDSAAFGMPTFRIQTRQGSASVWLLRYMDTVFVAASIPDTTPYWGDDFVLSVDTQGDGAPSPQHDDFQLDFRRMLDSSVVYRGRNGRWQAPRDDPFWRIGSERTGGGWEVSGGDGARGWHLLLRLDPAWFVGDRGRLPRVGFRIYDDSPGGWFSWHRLDPGSRQAMWR